MNLFKHLTLLTFFSCSLSLLAAERSLTIYAYDAFTADGAMGPILAKAFEAKTGVKTTYVGFPTAGEALNQIALEGANTHADLIVGIDNTLVQRAKELHAFQALDANQDSKLLGSVPAELRFDSENFFLPFDYGYLSLIYDSARGTSVPSGLSLSDFASSPAFRKKLIIQDPRTSSIGLSFLSWTHLLYGEKKVGPFWDKLSQTIVSTAPSWSGAYALFLRREADFVVSYTTSPAYHRVKEKKTTFKAVIFPEGNFRQVESIAIIKHSKNQALAKEWAAFLLSPKMQTEIPTAQWMYPVLDGTKLPSSFQELPKVTKTLQLDPSQLQVRSWLREWTHHMARLK